MKEEFIKDLQNFIAKHPYIKINGEKITHKSVHGIMGEIRVKTNDKKEIKNEILIQY